MKTRWFANGFVYLIGQLEGCYKIGWSVNPPARIVAYGRLPVELTPAVGNGARPERGT